MNTKQQGDVGVAMAIAYYTKTGYGVSTPLTDNLRYDLIVDDGTSLQRVQVKTTFYVPATTTSYEVNFKTSGGNQSWNRIRKNISEDETELVFVYCGDGTMYQFPAKVVAGKDKMRLSKQLEQYKIEL
jgi:PD-(D/E)XK nuclease superfamily protein